MHQRRTKARYIPEFLVFAARKINEFVNNHLHLWLANDFDELSQAIAGDISISVRF
jgi:hypothetical protein